MRLLRLAALAAALLLAKPAFAAYIPFPSPWTPIIAKALTNTAGGVTIDANPGSLGYYFCWNPNAAVTYLQIFDSASVTLGTTVPVLSLGIPPTSSGNLEWTDGVTFTNSIKVDATTTVNGSTAPSTAIDCNFGYR